MRFVSGAVHPSARRTTLPFGWFTTVDGSVTAGQPDQSHTIYPVNDHPADKASYTIRFDVPDGRRPRSPTASCASRSTPHGRTHGRVYQMREPMASELIQLAVGSLDVIQRGFVDGVRVRDVAPHRWRRSSSRRPRAHARPPALDDERGRPLPVRQLRRAGRRPDFGYALETQTLSLHPAFLFAPDVPLAAYEPIMVHELAHQWFGDSVAPVQLERRLAQRGPRHLVRVALRRRVLPRRRPGYDFVPRVQRGLLARATSGGKLYGPVAQPIANDLFDLFSANVYDGGALVLYALRQVIGERTFSEIERRWVQQLRRPSR